MAQISVGAAIGAGFGLIARRPLSVITWGVIPMALQVAVIALLAPVYLSFIGEAIASAHGGAVTPPTFAPQYLQLQALAQLFNLLQLGVSAVVYCAVFRSILHPEQSAFAYLRVGAPELFSVVLIIAGFIGFIIGLVVIMIPIGIVFGIVVAVSHGGGAGLVALLPLLMIVVFLGILFIALRFVFAVPMMVEDGKFHLFESWTLTRGRVGSLFLIALGLIGLTIVLEVVILVPMFAIGAAAVVSLGGIQQAMALFQQSPAAALARLWPFLVAYGVILVPIMGCSVAIWGAPWARAYQDVAPDTSQVFA